MSADVLEHTDTTTVTNDGEHDRFAHYVRKTAILEAQVNGIPARALCGKVWTPNADPDRYGVCPTCKEIYDDNQRFLDNDA